MPYLFTSESVSEGHPDKVADQISDALIDYFLAYDPNSKVACERLVTTGGVVLADKVKRETSRHGQHTAGAGTPKLRYTHSEHLSEGTSPGLLTLIETQTAAICRCVALH